MKHKDKRFLAIEFYDRNNVLRFTIGAGEKVPSGHIVSKGWTIKATYRTQLWCEDCSSWVGPGPRGTEDCFCPEV